MTKSDVRNKNRKAVTRFDRTPISPVDAVVKKLDMLVHELTIKWGDGVLINLAQSDTAAKFLRASARLDDAISSNDYDTVKSAVENMMRGWKKLEADAIAAGYSHMVIDEVWHISDEELTYVICKNELDRKRYVAKNPAMNLRVFDLEHVLKMIQNKNKAQPIPAPVLTDYQKYLQSRPDIKSSKKDCIIDDDIPF